MNIEQLHTRRPQFSRFWCRQAPYAVEVLKAGLQPLPPWHVPGLPTLLCTHDRARCGCKPGEAAGERSSCHGKGLSCICPPPSQSTFCLILSTAFTLALHTTALHAMQPGKSVTGATAGEPVSALCSRR